MKVRKKMIQSELEWFSESKNRRSDKMNSKVWCIDDIKDPKT